MLLEYRSNFCFPVCVSALISSTGI